MQIKPHHILLLPILLLTSCGANDNADHDGSVIASIYEQTLTQEEIDAYFGFTPDSSNQQWYIDRWLKDVIAYEKAKEDGINNSMKIDAMVEDYRKDLVLREYYRQNVMELLDTVVTQQQLENFYNSRKNDYLLNEPYIRIVLAHVPNLDNNLKQVNRFAKKNNFWEKDNFLDFLLENSGDLELPEGNWYSQTELNKKLPEGIYFTDLKTGAIKVESNEQFIYLINVIESFQEGDIPPLHSVEGKLKERLLFERRKVLESDFKNKLLEDAEDKGDIYYSSN